MRGVWRELYGPEPMPIPPYSRDWGETGTREPLAEAARTVMLEMPVDGDRSPGALILFRMRTGAVAKHCGIVTAPDRFIHAYERTGVIEVPLDRRLAPADRLRLPVPGVVSGTQTACDRNPSTAAKTSSFRPTQTCPPVGKLISCAPGTDRRDVARGVQGLEAVVRERERERRRPDGRERHRLRRAGELAVVDAAHERGR